MSYLLTNQRDPQQTIRLSNQAWFGILELAEDYGWRPLGTIMPESYGLAGPFSDDPSQWYGDYWSAGERLVIVDDALNMGDALSKAYVDYEPIRKETLHPFFADSDFGVINRPQPGIGIVKLLAEFCLYGSFFIEQV
jgi:hypothetical protein